MKWMLLLFVVGLSCSQPDDINNTNNQPEISFDINGKHYSIKGQGGANITGVFANKITLSGTSSYIFSGYLNNGNMISIEIGTGSDTLRQTSYTLTSSAGSVNATIYADSEGYLLVGQDPRNLTITSYQNGIVNGMFNFTASKIVIPPAFVPTIISNGVIKNVKINY